MTGRPEDTPDYAWLIENRRKVQVLLFDLYKYLEEHPSVRCKEPDRLIYGHLVAIAFSLWRAIVFAHHPRDWDAVFKGIKTALKKIIEDNSFLFPDEKTSASWTVTYYLQNARLRLFYAIDEHATTLKNDPQYSQLRNKIKAGFDREGRAICDDVMKLTCLLFDNLKLLNATP